MTSIDRRDRIAGALLGVALGLPFEGLSRRRVERRAPRRGLQT